MLQVFLWVHSWMQAEILLLLLLLANRLTTVSQWRQNLVQRAGLLTAAVGQPVYRALSLSAVSGAKYNLVVSLCAIMVSGSEAVSVVTR